MSLASPDCYTLKSKDIKEDIECASAETRSDDETSSCQDILIKDDISEATSDSTTAIMSENGQYKCTQNNCNRVYSRYYNLKKHMLIHCNTFKYSCEYCGKKFTLKQNLKEHVYTHTGERPYVCSYPGCTKKFRQRGKLSIHKKVHDWSIVDVPRVNSARRTGTVGKTFATSVNASDANVFNATASTTGAVMNVSNNLMRSQAAAVAAASAVNGAGWNRYVAPHVQSILNQEMVDTKMLPVPAGMMTDLLPECTLRFCNSPFLFLNPNSFS
mmetsp:Transcript_47868/g.55142  ORF Transcript_47868/g.55142 Transcript_47868/m.55142 type:complete len:271 (+) Transcript_47868:266-1078(+)